MGNIFKCCGKTGKPAVRIIAYIDIILAITALIGWILYRALEPSPPPEKESATKYQSTPHVVGIIVAVALFFVECCLANIILSALKNKSAGLCDNWIKIRLILLCLFVFGLLYCLSSSGDLGMLFVGGGGGLIYILYRVYTLLVVKHYQNEVSPKDVYKVPIEIIPMHPIISPEYP